MTATLTPPAVVDQAPAVGDRTPGDQRPGALRRLRDAVREHRTSLLYLVPLLALTALTARIGLFGAPQRIDDEGTYTAQAFAVERFGELAHYTYWYDHPPLGWIQIAGYTWLTNAFDRYDLAVMAGRESMVFFHVVTAGLVWLLARRLDLSRPAAAAAVLVVALSPLSVQFSRTVYLDNVALPWMIAAFVLALSRRRQLLAFAGAAVCFGIACLSKETFLLALPFLAWVMWRSSAPETRRYTLSASGALLTLVLGFYGLLALVKGEVFPGEDRVSLWEGIVFQLASRESSGSVFDADSQSGQSVSAWLNLDPVLIVAGTLAAVVGLGVRRLRPFAAALLVLGAVVFRPGYLPVMYVIMLIPFAAVLIAAVVDLGLRHGRRRLTALTALAAVAASAVAAPLWATQLRGLFLADLDRPMREAQSWMSDNVQPNARVLVDNAIWVDMVQDGAPRQNVVWYFKADTDPDVSALAPNGWQDYDYIFATSSLRQAEGSMPTVDEAIANSTRVAVFGDGDGQVDILRVDPRGAEELGAAADRAQQARFAAGNALLDNPGLSLSDQAARLLADGQVDARVLTMLASAASGRELVVDDFPAVFGEDGQVPRRTVELSSAGSGPAAAADAAQLVTQIEAQGGSFAADAVDVDGDRLVVQFPVSPPRDLLPVPAS